MKIIRSCSYHSFFSRAFSLDYSISLKNAAKNARRSYVIIAFVSSRLEKSVCLMTIGYE